LEAGLVEGKLEAPKHLARTEHDLYFEPKYEEFRPRTIWSLSNTFTSAFKELDEYDGVRIKLQAELAGAPIPMQIDIGSATDRLAATPERTSRAVSGLFSSLLKTWRTKTAAPRRDYL